MDHLGKSPAQQVWESLYSEPEKWKQVGLTLDHENGTKLWTGNIHIFDIGVWRSDEGPRTFTLAEKWKVRRAYRAWLRRPITLFFPKR